MNSDFKDLLSLLNQFGAKYLVVGGYAVMLYTEPRYTKDLDLAIGMEVVEVEAVRKALEAFGFPMSDEAAAELAQPNKMISIGRPPSRIDILNHVAGIDFQTAWERRTIIDIGGVAAAFLSREDLVKSKRAAGRPQDLLDLARLQELDE